MRFSFQYTGIRTRDFERSLRFYRDVLGMRILRGGEDEANRGRWAVLETEDAVQTLEVNWYAEDSPVAGPYRNGDEIDHLAFRVDDFEEATAFLESKGHPLVMGPIADGKYRVGYVQDPDGIWVEVYEVRE